MSDFLLYHLDFLFYRFAFPTHISGMSVPQPTLPYKIWEGRLWYGQTVTRPILSCIFGIAQDMKSHLLVCQTTDLKVQEGYRLGSIVRRDFCPALQIDADFEQVVTSMLNQNFVPIVDGRNVLCGILTRKRLIEFLAQARDKKE